MLHAVAPLDLLWRESGYGFQIDDKRLTLSVWADYFWIFASSHAQLKKMLQSLSDVLQNVRLSIKPESLAFLTTNNRKEEALLELELPDGPNLSVPRVTCMDILGTKLSEDGRDNAAVDHRISCATKAFWADSAVLTSKAIPVGRRLHRFGTRVIPVVLYSSGSWSWSSGLLRRLRAWELLHLRRIYKLPRRQGELWVPYLKRTARYMRKDYAKRGHDSINTSTRKWRDGSSAWPCEYRQRPVTELSWPWQS